MSLYDAYFFVVHSLAEKSGPNQTPFNRQIVPHCAPYNTNIKTAKKRLEDLRKEKTDFLPNVFPIATTHN